MNFYLNLYLRLMNSFYDFYLFLCFYFNNKIYFKYDYINNIYIFNIILFIPMQQHGNISFLDNLDANITTLLG